MLWTLLPLLNTLLLIIHTHRTYICLVKLFADSGSNELFMTRSHMQQHREIPAYRNEPNMHISQALLNIRGLILTAKWHMWPQLDGSLGYIKLESRH